MKNNVVQHCLSPLFDMLVAQGAKEIPLLKVQIQRVLCWIQGIPTMTETMGSYGKHGVISWGCFCFGVFFFFLIHVFI